MTIELLNFYYFFFIVAAFAILIGLYFALRNRSERIKTIVVFALLLSNLILHFLKIHFPPYSTDPNKAARDIWFINICAVSVLTFPIFYISKNKTLKDYMFYLGALSGFLALVYPTEALGKELVFDVWRFYYCHIVIFVAPILMVLLKIHELDYRRIWRIPFVMSAVLLFIMVQQVLQAELGIISLRSDDFFDINVHNPSLIWGPGNEEVAGIIKVFTPDFLTKVPFGEFKGETKYWPFFWMLPFMTIVFAVFPFLMCLPWEWEHIVSDFQKLFKKKEAEEIIELEKM
jgi:hypothetical protein